MNPEIKQTRGEAGVVKAEVVRVARALEAEALKSTTVKRSMSGRRSKSHKKSRSGREQKW